MFQPDKLADLIHAPKVVADPLSIDGMIAWLETRPANEEYCYVKSDGCLYAQYGEYLGYGKGEIGYRGYLMAVTGLSNPTACDEPYGRENPYLSVARGGARNFGAALERAREWKADRSA